MGKQHNNILPFSMLAEENVEKIEFICRGCLFGGRENRWYGYLSSISNDINQEMDNSYLILVEEPENKHDSNAIKVVVKGEFYGTIGYVGKEFTARINKILAECKKYRIDAIKKQEYGKPAIKLEMSWIR